MSAAQDLLERALAKSGMSLTAFAEDVMVRDARTVRRWRAGDVEIPDIAVRRLEQFVRE